MDFTKAYDFSGFGMGRSVYAGANGKKISIIIDGIEFMLKFPAPARHNENLHYANSIASEFIGSNIFRILGINAQEAYIGTYAKNGKEYSVVACRDFTEQGKYTFYDFASLKNTIIESSSNGYGTELISVIEAIQEQIYIDPDELSRFFWDMIVVDALIANFDRHNGNWGFLSDNATGKWSIAPVFDCGSSLYPQADENVRRKIMSDRNELEVRLYNRPLSVFRINNEKLGYTTFLPAGLYEECDIAVIRMSAIIDEKLDEIIDFINHAPIIKEDKDFYIFMLKARKEAVIDNSVKTIETISREKRRQEFSKRLRLINKL